MRLVRKIVVLFLFVPVLVHISSIKSHGISKAELPAYWPEFNAAVKPWTRWWWMGSAVDKQNVTNRLEEFAMAGLGGVEITPIYGVRGYEDQYLPHLSPEWMEMLVYTMDEAARLGLGVDMVPGTGWPFGGPQVEREYAASKIFIRAFPLQTGEELKQLIRIEDTDQEDFASLQYIVAFDQEGRAKDLTSYITGGRLNWIPGKDYMLYAVFLEKTGQMVKRAAPGGEGFTLDHFSGEAFRDYIDPYNRVLGAARNKLRAVFNDSYEIYGADYTPRFFEEFRQRRGYELKEHLPSLVSDAPGDEDIRICGDYRETLSDLILEDFSENWTSWARDMSFKTRYQAHGSPGNLLDIYATADIPECETFYATRFDIPGLRWEESDALEAHPDMIMLKFASSAAHISGKPIISSETFTWLREHFKTALSQCKPEVEQVFLSGVNHVFLHGSTYYPDEAEWPGWKFYASVNFVPNNTIWKDAPYLFEYITRCQSMLQSGKSDNEILVYWPFHDVIGADSVGRLLLQLGIDNKDDWLVPSSFYRLVSRLMEHGYSVDFISDRYLLKTVVEEQKIRTAGLEYKALIIPDCLHMPVATLESVIRLNKGGGKVIFEGLPETVPGYYLYRDRTDRLQDRLAEAKEDLIVVPDVPSALAEMGIMGETLKEKGLEFVRRDVGDGKVYYLVNHSREAVEGFISLGCSAKSILIMDPLSGEVGQAMIKPGSSDTDVYLRMKPGQAILLRTFNKRINEPYWPYFEPSGDPVSLTGTWEIDFLDGGPELPENAQMRELKSWTGLGGRAEAFSGTARYTMQFINPDPEISDWLLDLGDVRESARVWINGEYLGCLWSVPFEIKTGKLSEGVNILEVEVTNLPANRLRDLELKGTQWKNFYDINMVNRHYRPFNATGWDPMPSGLLGKVTLAPLHEK